MFIFICCGFSSAESIKKIVDKSSIKFIHGIKLDIKSGKTEDRILVSCCFQVCAPRAGMVLTLCYINAGLHNQDERVSCTPAPSRDGGQCSQIRTSAI